MSVQAVIPSYSGNDDPRGTLPVLEAPGDRIPVGTALRNGCDAAGVAIWRPIVRGVELQGNWIVIDREYRPAREDRPPAAVNDDDDERRADDEPDVDARPFPRGQARQGRHGTPAVRRQDVWMKICDTPAQSRDRGRTSGSEDDRSGEPGFLPMPLFYLLVLGSTSFLHPRGPSCAVPGEPPPSASCATTILGRRPLIGPEERAGGDECGESNDDGVGPLLGPVAARRKGKDPRRAGDVARRPARRGRIGRHGRRPGSSASGGGRPLKTPAAPAASDSREASLAAEEGTRGPPRDSATSNPAVSRERTCIPSNTSPISHFMQPNSDQRQ